jgi:3-oxoacyl-[acyl-carrier protein] reductase
VPVLDGSSAVVFGGGSGIGADVARTLAAAGAKVTVTGPDEQPLRAVAAETGGDWAVVDVTVEGGVADFFAGLDTVDICVYCCGVGTFAPLLSTDLSTWRRLMAVNVEGALSVVQAAATVMLRAGRSGSIVTITSINAEQPVRGMGAYSASKAALVSLTQVAALELASAGIRVNAVTPGVTATAMLEPVLADSEVRAAFVAHTPAGRIGTPADITGAVLFCCSPESTWVTGQIIHADGGLHLCGSPSGFGPPEMWQRPGLLRMSQEAGG